ncbi:hypothetical protein BZG36_02497 [Bifiguratus adelaidae]|uniref:Chromate transporter n=1 Tax=Bifiguratus adelaidae TaxID=1938954 RepID=A0A261Y2T1_9FUNG|nr:hypothetical protein BZG36_02497 [Bifiguratus adelaidae]
MEGRHSLPTLWIRLKETTFTFVPLLLTTFGGPNAHLGILHENIVKKARWVDEATFSELFAISSALPGPASTEIAYSLALVRNGFLCAFWAFVLWSVLGFTLMTSAAFGVSNLPQVTPLWLLRLEQTLSSAAVGIIALAAVRMGSSICVDRFTTAITILVAGAAMCYKVAWLYPALMAAGGLISLMWELLNSRHSRRKRKGRQPISLDDANVPEDYNANIAEEGELPVKASESTLPTVATNQSPRGLYTYPRWVAGTILTVVLLLLVITFPISTSEGVPIPLAIFATFYVVGSIIFGGGSVVIALLQSYCVTDRGWVTNQEFLLGLALIQALPGPNFNFAAYLGVLAMRAVTTNGFAQFVGGLLAFVGIFLPGLALMASVIPFWQKHRDHPMVASIFRGVKSAAVGLIFAAVWILWKQVRSAGDGATLPGTDEPVPSHEDFHSVVVVVSYALGCWWNWPTQFIVIAGGVMGGCVVDKV